MPTGQCHFGGSYDLRLLLQANTPAAAASSHSIFPIRLTYPMQIEERIQIAVAPEVIDHIWSEVDQWHIWDPDTKQASLNGPFSVGTKGRIVPHKGMGVPMEVTERTEGRSFTAEAYIPLFRMHFEHTVTSVAGGSEVIHRVWFTGPFTFMFGPSVARQVREGLPRTMQSLKEYAEKRLKPVVGGA